MPFSFGVWWFCLLFSQPSWSCNGCSFGPCFRAHRSQCWSVLPSASARVWSGAHGWWGGDGCVTDGPRTGHEPFSWLKENLLTLSLHRRKFRYTSHWWGCSRSSSPAISSCPLVRGPLGIPAPSWSSRYSSLAHTNQRSSGLFWLQQCWGWGLPPHYDHNHSTFVRMPGKPTELPISILYQYYASVSE